MARRLAPGIRTATGAPAENLFSANGRAGREGERFDFQLPKPGAAVPSRSELT